MTVRGPRAPGLVQMVLLYRDPVGYLERCRRRFGPVFRIRFPGSPPFAYVTEPDLARALYAHDRDAGRAGDAREPYLTPLVGANSILCLEDGAWQRQRRLLAPPLHGERIAAWREEIAAIARTEAGSWPLGEPLALHPRMQAITLEVILRLVFGIDDAQRQQRLRGLLTDLLDAVPLAFISPPLRRWLESSRVARRLPRNPAVRFGRIRDAVDEHLYDEISRRRALPAHELEQRTDLMSALLTARDEDGSAMSDTEVRDELVTLLVAGHETTATALAWTFERLARHPDVRRRLAADLDGGDTAYLDAVIKEVLRARPVVFDTPRALSEAVTLGGHELPGGWFVAPAIALVQRSDTAFPDPDRFDPGRFLAEDPPLAGWIPFGGGRRRCIGSRLALLELQTVIATVLERFDVTAADPEPERQRVRHVTLAPARGARVKLTAA